MFKTSLKLPPNLRTADTATLSESISDLCGSYCALREDHNHEGPWVLEWFFDALPDHSILKARIEITAEIHSIDAPNILEFIDEELPERDWLAYSYRSFPAFSVGPFFIYGSHCDDGVPARQFGLQIDAATAFGSGEHGTTAGCLQVMVDLESLGACPWNVLDMGTGSGILGIAAWKLWKTPVLAVDNDPESIRVTQRHMAANGVKESKGNMQVMVNEGFAGGVVKAKGPFDLIIANILPGPLKDMAGDLIDTADENGYVILSGILNEQVPDVLAAYDALALRDEIKIDGWSSLLLQNTPA